MDAWREFTSANAVPIIGQSGQFRAWQRRWEGRSLHFRHTFCTGQVARYRQTRLHDDSVVLCYLQDGPAFAWEGSAKIAANPGDIYMLDANRTDAFYIQNSEILAITMPYSVFSITRNNMIKARVFSRNSVIARMFATALTTAFSEPATPKDDNSEMVEDILCSLTKTLILHQKPDDQARNLLPTVRRDAIRDYIERHLEVLDLASPHLEQAFHVSRATIARDFAVEGGVTRYITHRRLEHALQALTRHPPHRGEIARVAARSGYSDPAHFSRAFRGYFGFTPSDAARLACPGG